MALEVENGVGDSVGVGRKRGKQRRAMICDVAGVKVRGTTGCISFATDLCVSTVIMSRVSWIPQFFGGAGMWQVVLVYVTRTVVLLSVIGLRRREQGNYSTRRPTFEQHSLIQSKFTQGY